MRFPGKVVADVEAAVTPLPRRPGARASAHAAVALDDDYDPGPSPAMVGGSVSFTSSGNYRSLSMTVRCEVPSRPTEADMAARTMAAFDFAYKVLDAQAPVLSELQRRLGMDVPPQPAPPVVGLFAVPDGTRIAAEEALTKALRGEALA